MPVTDIDKLEGHGCGAFHGILISASRAKTAVTSKRNKFQFATFGTTIRSPTKCGVSTVYHLLDIFDNRTARMKRIYHFFIMVFKDLLKYVHVIYYAPKGPKK
jgi:hypothetical protein